MKFERLLVKKPWSFPPTNIAFPLTSTRTFEFTRHPGGGGGGGGHFKISGWGCAAGTLEPLAYTYTRASSADFCYAILE